MPNRNPSESEPAYQQLVAGLSPHKGLIDGGAAPPQSDAIEMTQPESVQPQSVQPQSVQPPLKPAATFGDQLRQWTSHLFGDRKE